MDSFFSGFGGFIDQINPASRNNQVLFLIWLVITVFTGTALWRCSNRWIRLVCLLINQMFSMGILLSWAQIVVPAYILWKEALVAMVLTVAVAWFLFRKRRPKGEPEPRRRGRKLPREDVGAEELRSVSDEWAAQAARRDRRNRPEHPLIPSEPTAPHDSSGQLSRGRKEWQ